MKKRTVFIIAAFSIYAAALVSGRSGAHAAQDPFTVIGDFGSASSSDNAMSPVVNPVFADAPGTPMLSYRILRFNGERKADHLAALRFMGFSLVGGWLDSLYSESDDDIVSTGMNCYNISKGFLFDGAWGFGLGYSFGKGRDAFDNYRAWSAGFLLRPAQWISLGAAGGLLPFTKTPIRQADTLGGRHKIRRRKSRRPALVLRCESEDLQ
jgi:hypothetical protein